MRFMRLENMTPHPINICASDGEIVIPSSCRVARLEVTCVPHHAPLRTDMGDIPLWWRLRGAVTGLPAAQPGVGYVVSALVAEAVEREDVYSPAELVRDSAGRVIGCKGLVMT